MGTESVTVQKAPFNDEMKRKMELQQAILTVSQQILWENKDEVLRRATVLLDMKHAPKDAIKKED